MEYEYRNKIYKIKDNDPRIRDDSIEGIGEIIARKEYGKRGVVGAVFNESIGEGYSIWSYFIGVHADKRCRGWRDMGITGHNVQVIIYD